MREIPLTKGYFAKVDDADFESVAQFKWCASSSRGKVYAMRAVRGADGLRRYVKLHRLIANAPDGMVVDHIDGDGLNCQRANLRVCTQAENVCNRGAQANNKSGVKGISWKPEKRKWYAQIARNGRYVHLGSFETADEAAQAYRQAATSIQGEFAKTD